MSKDYAQIANDVVRLSFDCGNGYQSPRHKNKGTDGARDRYRGSR